MDVIPGMVWIYAVLTLIQTHSIAHTQIVIVWIYVVLTLIQTSLG